MFGSSRIAYLALRIGLALTFLWLGIQKFIAPDAWVSGWIPAAVADLALRVHVTARDLANLTGLVEVLAGLAIASGFFVRSFAVVGVIVLLVGAVFHGIGTASASVGLIGGLVALALWPERWYV